MPAMWSTRRGILVRKFSLLNDGDHGAGQVAERCRERWRNAVRSTPWFDLLGFMTDREFLMWIHERLEHAHGEDKLVDYMHRLRSIIRATPEDRRTLDLGSCNSLDQLRQELSNATRSATGREEAP